MAWSKTYRGDEPQRVNKWLAHEGVCSRREAEDLIGRGLVSIDGTRVEDVGRKIECGQTLTLADVGRPAITVVVNKPVGFVSAQPEAGQTPAARLVVRANLFEGAMPEVDKNTRLAPLGRLDQDSHGLLLLSEDGVLAKAVIGPESKLDKEYRVRVAGQISDRKLALLRHGLALDGRKLKPARVSLTGEHQIKFVLTEGRNRQIRRMCELVDLEVTDLLRVRIGPLRLGALPEGKWRPLAPPERDALVRDSH
ncbi:pseudouridine synthase [Terricaulis sp.]|uniref:pseudouridine synthase n=1 Tax=Terricaulis sp. TaxID=2768686 RepID=UPI003782F5B1